MIGSQRFCFVLLPLFAILLLASSLGADVTFNVGSSPTAVCPGKTGPLGSVQFVAASAGTISNGTAISISINPALLAGTPNLSGAPPSVSLTAPVGGSTINISFTADTAVGVGAVWILSVGSATAPSSVPASGVSITASISVLIPLGSPNVGFSSTTPVIAFVSPIYCTGHMIASVSSLQFGAVLGSDPPQQSLTVYDSVRTGVSLGLSAIGTCTPAGWLNIQGLAESDGVVTIPVAVQSKTMAEGTYTGNIQLTSAFVDNSPLNIPVTLTIGRNGVISLSATKLSFVAEPGKNPPAQQLMVTNAGTGTLAPFARAVMTGGFWLNPIGPDPNSPTEPSVFTVNVLSASLAPGVYNGTIYIYSDIASNSPQKIPVDLTVRSPSPTIALAPASLTFNASAGKNPDPQTFTVSNSDIGRLDWQGIVGTAGGNWLTLSPASGTAPTTVTATVNITGLQQGAYSATINISSSSDGITNSPQIVPVLLTIGASAAPPTIALSQSKLTLTADQGTAPAAQSIKITNSGGGTLAWTAIASVTGSGSWLSVTPASGNAGDSLQVTVASAGLAPGNYSGTIAIGSTSSGVTNSPQTIPVTLTVGSVTPVITLGTNSVAFSALPNSNPPAAQTVSITNGGDGTLNWSAAVNTVNGGTWLSVLPSSGTAPSTLTVSADISRLAAGVYTGTITISSTGATATPRIINVTLSLGIAKINSVVNAAHLGSAGLAPGGLIAIFGTNLANSTRNAPPIPYLPDQLGDTIVKIGTFKARLSFISPTQVNAQVPAELTDATAPVKVSVAGIDSDPLTLSVLPYDPGLFTFSGDPGGAVAALHSEDYSAINSTSPAVRGKVILLFGTGFGPVTPSVSSGQPGSKDTLNQTVQPPRVLIGDKPARILFAGLAPGLVGVYQVNVEVPADAPPGDSVSVVLGIGGRGTNYASIPVK